MLKVKDIMTRQVITCEAATAVKEAARLMYLNGLTGLPVLDSDNKLIGIITDRDLVKLEGPVHTPKFLGILGSLIYLDNPLNGDEIEKQLHTMTATKVEELMSKDVTTISPEESVDALAEVLAGKKANPIPVVDGDKLVGIVSRADIVKLLADDEELRKNLWTALVKK